MTLLTSWIADPFLEAVAAYTARQAGYAPPRRQRASPPNRDARPQARPVCVVPPQIPRLMELPIRPPAAPSSNPPTPSPTVSPLGSPGATPPPLDESPSSPLFREQCSICLHRKVTVRTECTHRFCGTCIENIFTCGTYDNQRYCPTCVQEITGWAVLPGVEERQPDFQILRSLPLELPVPEDDDEIIIISDEESEEDPFDLTPDEVAELLAGWT